MSHFLMAWLKYIYTVVLLYVQFMTVKYTYHVCTQWYLVLRQNVKSFSDADLLKGMYTGDIKYVACL